MKPEDFITRQLVAEQMVYLKTAAEQVHAIFCIVNHEDECKWYQATWDEPDRQRWLEITIRIMQLFSISNAKDLLVFIAKARKIIADNGAAMVGMVTLISSPHLLEEVLNEDTPEHTDSE